MPDNPATLTKLLKRSVYDKAITYFKTGAGNGAVDKAVYYVHPGYLGQW